jgi:hypothetical protein
MGLRNDDLLKPLISTDCLVRSGLVQVLTLNAPTAFAKLEKCGRVSAAQEILERAGLEMNADKSKQVARLPVARPQNLVVPLGGIPSLAFGSVDFGEGRDEPCFKPFALLVEKSARVIDVNVLDDLAERSPQDHPGHDRTSTKYARADQQTHGVTLDHLPELAVPSRIVESGQRRSQGTEIPRSHRRPIHLN